MALTIRDAETSDLVRRYAAMKGLDETQAVKLAVSAAIDHCAPPAANDFLERVRRIQEAVAEIPQRNIPADDIIGYDEHGVPR